MYCLYLLLKKYLDMEIVKEDDTFYSKAIINQSILDTLEMLQEDNNEEIRSNTSRLNEISRLICEWRGEFGLPDKEILQYMDSINSAIYYIEQMQK